MSVANPFTAPEAQFTGAPHAERVVRRLVWVVALLAVTWLVGMFLPHSRIADNVRRSLGIGGMITVLLGVPFYWELFCHFRSRTAHPLLHAVGSAFVVLLFCVPSVLILPALFVRIGQVGGYRLWYWPSVLESVGITYAGSCLFLVLCDWRTSRRQLAAKNSIRTIPVSKRKGLN